MSLVTMKKLLERAEAQKIAVGAFSVGNMEMVLGAIRAAEEMKTPIIIQIAEVRLSNSPLSLMAPMMISAAKNSMVDICVHLDHGLTTSTLNSALRYGFSSVMFDGSLLPFEENIRKTNEVVASARKFGASAEAELGVVGGNEGGGKGKDIMCTNPKLAKQFCKETDIDALAVAIGNAHGHYQTAPELRLDILSEINQKCDTPLVLHGGTGITPEMFQECIKNGVRKINIATASFDSLANAAKDYTKSVDKPNYFKLSDAEVYAVCQNVKNHIKIFNMDSLK